MDKNQETSKLLNTVEESVGEPVLADKEGIEILSKAIAILSEIYERIPEEQLDYSTVTINASRVCDFIEMLTAYADIYENVNIDKLEAMVEAERGIGKYKFGSLEVH